MGSLDGRVAIVTGAGRGIGREHALLLAAEGAAVVVNDLGGSSDGAGADQQLAADVVAQIVAAGGRAVASAGSVAEWSATRELVEQAVDTYGRLDVVVNNAGIVRDAYLASSEEEQVDAVLGVHLKGHLGLLHHAAAYWKAQTKAGRPVAASVINTSSVSGTTLPNPGQTAYGAAKAGIAALTLVAAIELERYGVRVNAIAPIARTRLTLTTPGLSEAFAAEVPAGEVDLLRPGNVAPIVAHLAHPDCPLTGKVFTVHGGAIALLEGWHEVDKIETEDDWTVAEMADRLEGWARA